jgi:hypothetical protein
MVLRLWRRKRLFPGARINLSKSGVSLSIGRKGAWYTAGKRGQRVTLGAPGTGLFWTERIPPHPGRADRRAGAFGIRRDLGDSPDLDICRRLIDDEAGRAWLWCCSERPTSSDTQPKGSRSGGRANFVVFGSNHAGVWGPLSFPRPKRFCNSRHGFDGVFLGFALGRE